MAWVQSLIQELRSHKAHSAAKKTKQNIKLNAHTHKQKNQKTRSRLHDLLFGPNILAVYCHHTENKGEYQYICPKVVRIK